MKRLTCLLLALAPFAARADLPVKHTAEYRIADAADTVRFIRIGRDTTAPKPVLLFLQGSRPYPLIVTEGGQGSVFYLDQCGVDYDALSQRCHVVLIAQPFTPVVAEPAQLNDRWEYVPDPARPDRFDARYQAADRPENHIRRADSVLDFIRRQPWADKRKIIVLGHSQGAHIAVQTALRNPDIRALGYFSGNPMGRFAELIAREDRAADAGRITRAEAQLRIGRLHAQWRRICRDEQGDCDSRATWTGFSRPYPEEMARMTVPVFIAYGTEDPGARNCVLLPVHFELAGKRNYRIRPFEGRGHNFERIGPDGGSDYDDMQWKQAIEEFLAWCENPEYE